MKNSDLLMLEACDIEINLSHQCKTENGIERDETFMVKEIIGSFKQVKIVNQYGIEYIINPNQIIK